MTMPSPEDDPTTTYDEPYRGQFHFSTASGWMNDINGFWHWNAVYHLAYQASPYSLAGGSNLHWARATSVDLLHWKQEPLMLVPGINVEGEAWSGSVVVDENDSSGLGGGEPVFVAAYTSTALGTSLAYSTDQGQSWQAHEANPVAIGDAAYETNRDPLVFWHEPSQSWICVYWQGGTTFYTSPDLRTWTQSSSVPFGALVPDFYELPLDGDTADTRWVLQQADGQYLVGQFDGATFVPDSAVAQDIDVGPHYFAARAAFRATLPDQRLLQLAWLRGDELTSAPWRGSATFPVELGLKTFPGGVKVTRWPIAEIADLYVNTRHWDAQTLAAGKNLLAGMRSKTFDLELVIDASATTASTLDFTFANKTFSYDFTTQSLLGAPLSPIDGIVTLRVLVDWGSLEIFGNGGELSYSEGFAFTPSDGSLSVSADAELTLISADFREVARTWPGTAAPISDLLDDAAEDIGYAGQWASIDDDSTYFADTAHVSQADDAALEATFTGTRLVWYGLENADLGKADVFIDGVLVGEGIDCYSPVRRPAELFAISELENSFHTVRIVATGERNSSSTGSAIVHDYFVASVALE